MVVQKPRADEVAHRWLGDLSIAELAAGRADFTAQLIEGELSGMQGEEQFQHRGLDRLALPISRAAGWMDSHLADLLWADGKPRPMEAGRATP